MNLSEITNIITQEKQSGKSFHDIRNLALTAGLSEAVFMPILQQNFSLQGVNTPEEVFWDPLHDHITKDSFAGEKYEARREFETLIKTPFKFRDTYKKRLIWGGIGTAIIGTILGFMFVPVFLNGGSPEGLGLIMLSLLCFVPAGITYSNATTLQKQILYQLVAKANKWICGPLENQKKWMRLEHRLPEFFKRGNQNQKITDEFWGSVTDQRGKEQKFYSGIFYFEVVRGSGKNRRVTKYSQRFYGFKLKKNHDIKLLITQDNFGKNLLRRIGLRKKDTDVESTIFNKKFETKITNSKNETLDIFRYLSPIAQDKLVELEKHNTNVTVAVLHDAAFFMNDKPQFNFPDLETKKIHTNFLKKIEVDMRDIKNISEQIKRIIPIAHAITDTWD
jgi:hypothetical protein